jgi:hypothetical protein
MEAFFLASKDFKEAKSILSNAAIEPSTGEEF